MISCVRPTFLRLPKLVNELLKTLFPEVRRDLDGETDKSQIGNELSDDEDNVGSHELLSIRSGVVKVAFEKVTAPVFSTDNTSISEANYILIQKLKTVLECMDIFSRTTLFDHYTDDEYQNFDAYLEDLLEDISMALSDLLVLPTIITDRSIWKEIGAEIKSEVLEPTLRCVMNLSRHALVKKCYKETNIFSALLGLFTLDYKPISYKIIETFSVFLSNGSFYL